MSSASRISASGISLAPASTIRMASSVPATIRSRSVLSTRSSSLGLTTKLPSTLPIRTAPTGVGNGMLETISAAEAPFMARMSYGLTWSTLIGSATSCVSYRHPLGNSGRIGRSIRRAVSVAFSPARPSRLKNDPGILPAAYIRSSTSTVSGRKSTSRMIARSGGTEDHSVARPDDNGAGGLLGQLAGLERDLLPLDLDGHARNGVRHIQFPSSSALRSAECFSFSSLVPNVDDGSDDGAIGCRRRWRLTAHSASPAWRVRQHPRQTRKSAHWVTQDGRVSRKPPVERGSPKGNRTA